MTAQTPAYLKARFENGDVPVAADYEDVFDSYVNVATSAEQTLLGNIRTVGQFVGDVSANRVTTSALTATIVSASTVTTDLVKATTVSANTLNASTVSAGSLYVNSIFAGALNVSAVSTTQASAVVLNSAVSFVIFADNTDNSVRLPSSVRGTVQSIINASTTAIKIFPAVSARFLVTAFNASLTIQADRVATIYHQGDDRYGIQVG